MIHQGRFQETCKGEIHVQQCPMHCLFLPASR
ncbi:rCG52692 [Rattus norvegicus]|uniref:RCG52692 n=1 Tax=Rattus norvegicus TaxID=10116 RepID=A6IQM0_RAT|nr:rCG52692 [Rattus norvegicus]